MLPFTSEETYRIPDTKRSLQIRTNVNPVEILVLDCFFQLVGRSFSSFSGLFGILKIYLGDNAKTTTIVDREGQSVNISMSTPTIR